LAISLYAASVPTYLQMLGALSGVLDKALAWSREAGVDLGELVEARLIEDMRPFRFQVQHTVFHSVGALEAMRSGELNFPGQRPEHDFAGLQGYVADAIASLKALPPDALDGREDREVLFAPPGREPMRFTTADFLFTFSLPNFFFHTTTAYDILRSRGAPLGKRDFMGAVRLKG
jgi:hypothetical protein